MTTNSYPFVGKTVLVTGGATGIGKAIVQAFVDNGANVVVSGRRKAKLDESVAGFDTDRVLAVASDVSDDASTADLVRAAVDRFGTLDVVVSNAAGYESGELTELPIDQWNALRSTNIDGFVNLSRHAVPALERSAGNWVTVGSVSALRGDWGQAAYNATKAAVVNFTQSLALDYGSRGVRFNAVAPAFTVTDLTAAVADDDSAMAAANNRVALGRPAYPADIAPAVLFLASDDAAYITGAILPVDGGTSASTGQAH